MSFGMRVHQNLVNTRTRRAEDCVSSCGVSPPGGSTSQWRHSVFPRQRKWASFQGNLRHKSYNFIDNANGQS